MYNALPIAYSTFYPASTISSILQNILSSANTPQYDGNLLFFSFQCILESGDLLFFPAFWWHQVTSLETTISVNMFFGDGGENNYLTKVMKSDQWLAFKHWLLNIIEQNRETVQFQRVLENLPESIEAFLLKQWHEIPTKEQLETLVQVVMDYLEMEKLVNSLSLSHILPDLET